MNRWQKMASLSPKLRSKFLDIKLSIQPISLPKNEEERLRKWAGWDRAFEILETGQGHEISDPEEGEA